MDSNTISDAVTMPGGAEGALLANRYRIVRQLGSGGMGSVWLAEDIQLDGKLFAIKMLPSILVCNKRAYRQLKDEALVAMKLTHTNIVTLRAFEENNGNPFLVMDYIDGQTLDDYLVEKGVLSEDETIKLLKPVAAALDYAHGEGVVHRDVKPANVMIRKDGHPFILDFGIAREIQETMTRVTGKLSSGTLLYMSPEQLNGEKPTSAQDIYSFAVMAYECLKGEPPFVRGAIEDQIKNKEPPSLVGTSGSVASFAEFVMAGLAKKPGGRPSTCASVLNVCDHGVKGRDVHKEVSLSYSRPESAVSHAQADCVRLMADAKVVQRHIARFSDDPDCKKDMLEIEDDFVRADAIFAEKQWALAAECYARIVERGKAMEEGVARRAAEEIARHEAEEKARSDAQELASCKAAAEAMREVADESDGSRRKKDQAMQNAMVHARSKTKERPRYKTAVHASLSAEEIAQIEAKNRAWREAMEETCTGIKNQNDDDISRYRHGKLIALVLGILLPLLVLFLLNMILDSAIMK